MFNENSGLVKVWIRQIEEGKQTIEAVPALGNLKEIVAAIIATKG